MPDYKKLKQSGDKRTSFIGKAIEGLEKLIQDLQEALLGKVEKNLNKMNVKAGEVLNDGENRAIITQIDALIKKFNTTEGIAAITLMAKDFGKVKGMVLDYYGLMDISRERLRILGKKLNYIDKIINRNLNILVGAGPVRLQITQYIQRAVLEGLEMSAFREGLKNIVTGTKETPGKLLRYYQQYGYDMYNQVETIYADETAKELGMEFAIYQGDIIKTSRDFCIKRAGKVYSREEMLEWKCDPDLIGKPKGQKCDESYTYIERGRWNCRHRLDWISGFLAWEMSEGRIGIKPE